MNSFYLLYRARPYEIDSIMDHGVLHTNNEAALRNINVPPFEPFFTFDKDEFDGIMFLILRYGDEKQLLNLDFNKYSYLVFSPGLLLRKDYHVNLGPDKMIYDSTIFPDQKKRLIEELRFFKMDYFVIFHNKVPIEDDVFTLGIYSDNLNPYKLFEKLPTFVVPKYLGPDKVIEYSPIRKGAFDDFMFFDDLVWFYRDIIDTKKIKTVEQLRKEVNKQFKKDSKRIFAEINLDGNVTLLNKIIASNKKIKKSFQKA